MVYLTMQGLNKRSVPPGRDSEKRRKRGKKMTKGGGQKTGPPKRQAESRRGKGVSGVGKKLGN